jgi:hypothetical protein
MMERLNYGKVATIRTLQERGREDLPNSAYQDLLARGVLCLRKKGIEPSDIPSR